MQTRRWLNPSQPQTLQIAVMLFYISAVFNVLLGSANTPYLLNVLIAVGFGLGGYGIANDRRWGYQLGVAAAGAQLFFEVVLPLAFEPSIILNPGFLLIAIFPVALFALLLHPMSRDYQRIWFE
jgi:hypothetical protein